MVRPIAAVVLVCSAIAGPARAVSLLEGPVTNPANGHAYYLLSNATWPESEAFAQALGGHLATVRGQSEDLWIFDTFTAHGTLSRALWIGLNDEAAPGVWDPALGRSTGTFTWSSGEPVTYTDFSAGQPNNAMGTSVPSEKWVHLWPPTAGGGIYSGAPAGSWNDYSNQAVVDGAFPLYGVAEVIPAPPLVTVDASLLSAPAGIVTLRLLGATSGVSQVFSGSTQATLADDTYSLTTYSGAISWGTFTVAGGAIVAATGGLVASGTSVGIDRSRLAGVRVDPAPLSTDADVVIRVGELTSGATTAFTLWLPDAVYVVTTYGGTGNFGSFTVAAAAVSATTGAVVPVSGGVSFDQARLTRVHVPSSALSAPAGHQLFRIYDLGGGSFSDQTYFLPDATWTAGDYAGAGLYGTFTTAAGKVAATTGALLPASDGLAFDLVKLTAVTLPVGSLSSPAGLQVARLGSLTAGEYTDTLLHVPDGTWQVSTYAGAGSFGSFTTSGGALVSTTGALSVTPQGALAFDRCKLGNVTITSAPGFYGIVSDATTYFGHGSTVSLALAPGTYPLFDVNAQLVFGSITATAAGISAVTSDPARIGVTPMGCAPPAPVLTAPASGSRVLIGAPLSVSGTAAAGAQIAVLDLLADGSAQQVASGAASAVGMFDVAVSLPCGAHTLAVTAAISGIASSRSNAVTLTVVPPAPAIATQPLAVDNHAGFAGSSFAAPGAIVRVREGSATLAVLPAPLGTWSFDALAPRLLADGPHALAFTTTVNGAESDAASASFLLWTQGPQLVVAVPLAGAVQGGLQQPVVLARAAGYAPPAGVSLAQLVYRLDDGIIYAGPAAAAPAALELSALAPGAHRFAAQATDNLGNAGGTPTVTFQYAPTVETDLLLAKRLLAPLSCGGGGDDDEEGRRCLGRGELRWLFDQLEDAGEALHPAHGRANPREAARRLYAFLQRLHALASRGAIPQAAAAVLNADVSFALAALGGPPRERDDD